MSFSAELRDFSAGFSSGVSDMSAINRDRLARETFKLNKDKGDANPFQGPYAPGADGAKPADGSDPSNPNYPYESTGGQPPVSTDWPRPVDPDRTDYAPKQPPSNDPSSPNWNPASAYDIPGKMTPKPPVIRPPKVTGETAGGPSRPAGDPSSPAGRVGQAAGATTAARVATGGSRGEVEAYIRQAAAKRGIDGNVAVRVAMGESSLNPAAHNRKGEDSRGLWQLNRRGGLGTVAEQRGISLDPSNWRQQTDFALDEVKRGGWTPWRAATKAGYGRWSGINRGFQYRPTAAGSRHAPPRGAIPSPGSGGGFREVNPGAGNIQAYAQGGPVADKERERIREESRAVAQEGADRATPRWWREAWAESPEGLRRFLGETPEGEERNRQAIRRYAEGGAIPDTYVGGFVTGAVVPELAAKGSVYGTAPEAGGVDAFQYADDVAKATAGGYAAPAAPASFAERPTYMAPRAYTPKQKTSDKAKVATVWSNAGVGAGGGAVTLPDGSVTTQKALEQAAIKPVAKPVAKKTTAAPAAGTAPATGVAPATGAIPSAGAGDAGTGAVGGGGTNTSAAGARSNNSPGIQQTGTAGGDMGQSFGRDNPNEQSPVAGFATAQLNAISDKELFNYISSLAKTGMLNTSHGVSGHSIIGAGGGQGHMSWLPGVGLPMPNDPRVANYDHQGMLAYANARLGTALYEQATRGGYGQAAGFIGQGAATDAIQRASTTVRATGGPIYAGMYQEGGNVPEIGSGDLDEETLARVQDLKNRRRWDEPGAIPTPGEVEVPFAEGRLRPTIEAPSAQDIRARESEERLDQYLTLPPSEFERRQPARNYAAGGYVPIMRGGTESQTLLPETAEMAQRRIVDRNKAYLVGLQPEDIDRSISDPSRYGPIYGPDDDDDDEPAKPARKPVKAPKKPAKPDSKAPAPPLPPKRPKDEPAPVKTETPDYDAPYGPSGRPMPTGPQPAIPGPQPGPLSPPKPQEVVPARPSGTPEPLPLGVPTGPSPTLPRDDENQPEVPFPSLPPRKPREARTKDDTAGRTLTGPRAYPPPDLNSPGPSITLPDIRPSVRPGSRPAGPLVSPPSEAGAGGGSYDTLQGPAGPEAVPAWLMPILINLARESGQSVEALIEALRRASDAGRPEGAIPSLGGIGGGLGSTTPLTRYGR